MGEGKTPCSQPADDTAAYRYRRLFRTAGAAEWVLLSPGGIGVVGSARCTWREWWRPIAYTSRPPGDCSAQSAAATSHPAEGVTSLQGERMINTAYVSSNGRLLVAVCGAGSTPCPVDWRGLARPGHLLKKRRLLLPRHTPGTADDKHALI